MWRPVRGCTALADDVADLDAQPGLLLDLADRGVPVALARLLLASDERPRRLAVVAAADQHAQVGRDNRGDDVRHGLLHVSVTGGAQRFLGDLGLTPEFLHLGVAALQLVAPFGQPRMLVPCRPRARLKVGDVAPGERIGSRRHEREVSRRPLPRGPRGRPDLGRQLDLVVRVGIPGQEKRGRAHAERDRQRHEVVSVNPPGALLDAGQAQRRYRAPERGEPVGQLPVGEPAGLAELLQVLDDVAAHRSQRDPGGGVVCWRHANTLRIILIASASHLDASKRF